MERKLKKRQKLRNNEYYDMQEIYDELYDDSLDKLKFRHLMEIISSENNIKLAYRNIKKNKGSVTPGTDKLNIDFIKEMGLEKYIKYIQDKLKNYNPKSVRRVEIPKPNGKTRPLGIPCIDDRIIQQCIKQILEPICEAKFHKHSYGFRPNRSTKHAIARVMKLMNQAKLHYVVDVDIQGFFDNVDHSKLICQIWHMGIQDKNLLKILGKILKSEIEGIGIPTKGTSQGGIISPLLSNIVLNELDWWVSSQWETHMTKHRYKYRDMYRALKKSNLKEMWIVRYADDFKIFCRDWRTAQKIFTAVKRWLRERLGLETSNDKSSITNLRRNYTEFVGIKLKVKPKRNKFVSQSRMTEKAKKTTRMKIKEQIKKIQKNTTTKEVSKLNSMIIGSHNYYKMATLSSLDFAEINFLVMKTLKVRLRHVMNRRPELSKTFKRLYSGYKGKYHTVKGVTIFPIGNCKTKPPMCFSQDICNYTEKGRIKQHEKLKGFNHLIIYLLNNVNKNENTELNDNRIALIAGQRGQCYVTKERLKIGNMECHHKKPKFLGGSDEYKNLVWVKEEVHKLIHSRKAETIKKFMDILELDNQGLKRVNSLRELVGNSVI